MDPKYLQPLGFRGLYVLSARVFRADPLPQPGEEHGLTTGDLEAHIDTAVLYRNLNFFRSLLYLPQGWACWVTGVAWGVWLIGAIVLVHLALALAESYREVLAKSLLSGAMVGPTSTHPCAATPQPPGPYFRPLPFESARLYKTLGVPQYGSFTVWVMTSVGNRRPDFLASPDSRSILEFEQTTCTSELVHLGLFASMATATVATVQAGILGPLVWSCVMAWGDLYLVFLQRYHRVRLAPLLRRARRNLA